MRYGGNQLMGMLCNHMMEKLAELKMTQYRNRLRKYLVEKGVRVDFSTVNVSRTAQIYAGKNLHLGGGLRLNDNCVIDAEDSYGIYVGNYLLAARDVFIRGGNHDYRFSELPFQKRGHCAKKIKYKDRIYSIVIEDNVWIGRGATILSGAYIGKGSVIGAGAVVKEYIPEYSIVIGNPSQIVSNRKKYPNFDHKKDIGIFP